MRGAPVQGDSKITLPSRGETWRQFGLGSACARASVCGYVRQRILVFRLRPSDRANRRDVFLFFVKFFKAFKSGNLFVS